MAELKTKQNNASVAAFIKSVDHEQRRKDAKILLKVFKEATGITPKMWGESIIGYGKYHYKSDRSSQEGDWPLTGFSPRKASMSIYIMSGFKKYGPQLKKLGKHKHTVCCLYINKVEDIDLKVLKEIIVDSVKIMKKRNK